MVTREEREESGEMIDGARNVFRGRGGRMVGPHAEACGYRACGY